MIRRSTWIALAVFAFALAGAIWYAKLDQSTPTPADATPTAQPLLNFPSQDVTALKIEDYQAGKLVSAHRDSTSGWVLDHPQGLADVGRLEIAADTLTSLVPSDSVAGGDLASFGLDSPTVRITVTRRNGSEDQLLVGQTSPTGDVTYVKLPSSDTVYFVGSYTLSNVTGLAGNPPIATATPTPAGTSTAMPTFLPTVTP